jgi:hypothetical protein
MASRVPENTAMEETKIKKRNLPGKITRHSQKT